METYFEGKNLCIFLKFLRAVAIWTKNCEMMRVFFAKDSYLKVTTFRLKRTGARCELNTWVFQHCNVILKRYLIKRLPLSFIKETCATVGSPSAVSGHGSFKTT